MTPIPKDVAERLREQAQHMSCGSKLLANAKAERNRMTGEEFASYDWLMPDQTLEWQAAALIDTLRRERDEADARIASHEEAIACITASAKASLEREAAAADKRAEDIPLEGWQIVNGADTGVPFDNRDTLIFALHRDGVIVGPKRAQRFRWLHDGDSLDVIAYAVATPANANKRAEEAEERARKAEIKYQNEYSIVDRIWRLFGSPSVEELQGRNIYDLVEEVQKRADELEQTFDLRWKADMRAIKRWQDAREGRELTWPDHADLCVWLLERADDLDKQVDCLGEEIIALRKDLEKADSKRDEAERAVRTALHARAKAMVEVAEAAKG